VHTLLGLCLVGVCGSLYRFAKSLSLTVRLDLKLTERCKANVSMSVLIATTCTVFSRQPDNPVNELLRDKDRTVLNL